MNIQGEIGGRIGRMLPTVLLGTGVLAFAVNLCVGAESILVSEVCAALFDYDKGQFSHLVVRELRLPRALAAVLTGAALAVAGALMQGVTRNPLADPGILGMMSGAAFTVVCTVGWLQSVSVVWMPLLAALGAVAAALLVWGIAVVIPGGMTPLVLVLCGAVVSALFSAFITIIHLLNDESFQQLRVWLSGALSAPSAMALLSVLPWLGLGFTVALGISRQLTVLAMGDETAAGLGVNVNKISAIAIVAAVALTAAAVALAGPLGFVGLVIPHVVRLLVGSDYRLIVPYAAGIGAVYLLVIDALARGFFAPTEIATGIVTAILGAPCFIYLVRARL